jgi:hypothetical protein
MEVSPFEPQLVFTLSLTTSKSGTYLDTWTAPTWSNDQAPFKCSAYQVRGNAVEFLTSVSPDLPQPNDVNGARLVVLAFAVDAFAVDGGLANATAGTKLIAPLYIVNAGNADLPSDIAPSGLLWSIETGDQVPDVTMPWKMRYGPHRDDQANPQPQPLPNSMVQCYPVISSHPGFAGDEHVTYTGYYLNAYRLDKSGTGEVYAESKKPPEWDVKIMTYSQGPLYGIPFQDPPPLILSD